MVDKKDHGKKTHSTRFLQDFFLDEEKLPEEYLSEESPIKKKRNAQRFYEQLCYAVFIESVHLYERFISFLQMKQEQLQKESLINAEHRAQAKSQFLIALSETQTKPLPPASRLEEQKQKLQEMMIKFNGVVSYLDEKIKNISQIIKEKNNEISDLQLQIAKLREQLVERWQSHLNRLGNDPDVALQIKILLPDEFKKLPGAQNYNDYLTINRDIYLELDKELNIISSQAKSTQQIHQHLRQIFEEKLKEELHVALDFIPALERQKFIEEKLQSEEVKTFISKSLWLDMIHDPTFIKQLHESYITEKKIENSKCELISYGNMKEKIEDLKSNILETAEKQLQKVRENIEKSKELRSDTEKMLDEINTTVDHCVSQVALYEDEPKKEFDFNALDKEANDLFEELAALKDQSEKKLETGLSENEQSSILITLNGIHQQIDTSFDTSKLESALMLSVEEEREQVTTDEIPSITPRKTP